MTASQRVLALADRVDDRLAARRGDPPGWDRATGPGPVASAWAVLKAAALLAATPALVPLVGTVAARNTARTRRLSAGYAAIVDDVLAGRPAPPGWDRVVRLPASGRYFIASDLHRYVRGSFDWPGGQDTKALYLAALGHYADTGHTLVEAGDVEDFWLVGGSTYAAAYDALRTLAFARGRRGRALLAEVHAEHLRRVVANNGAIYDLIQDRYHAEGRYVRLIGNHDDAFADPEVAAALRAVHPGLEVADFVAFDGPDGGVGVLTHGHHTDSWNGPGWSGLGRFGTSVASTIADLPVVGTELGVPAPGATDTFLGGRHESVLTPVNRWFGANRELYSVDEVLLFDAFRRQWGSGTAGGDLDGGPFLLLGHTHLPLSWPVAPGSTDGWRNYLNLGSGIHDGLVTGVEWDGTDDPARPVVRLVAWHWADRAGDDGTTPAAAVVASHGGRDVARRVTSRTPPARTLDLEPR